MYTGFVLCVIKAKFFLYGQSPPCEWFQDKRPERIRYIILLHNWLFQPHSPWAVPLLELHNIVKLSDLGCGSFVSQITKTRFTWHRDGSAAFVFFYLGSSLYLFIDLGFNQIQKLDLPTCLLCMHGVSLHISVHAFLNKTSFKTQPSSFRNDWPFYSLCFLWLLEDRCCKYIWQKASTLALPQNSLLNFKFLA